MSDIHVYQRFETSNSNETVEGSTTSGDPRAGSCNCSFFIPIGAVGRASRDHGAAKVLAGDVVHPGDHALILVELEREDGQAARCEAR